jgi:pimeloyl-ACP methyl ester carboxylesterase
MVWDVGRTVRFGEKGVSLQISNRGGIFQQSADVFTEAVHLHEMQMSTYLESRIFMERKTFTAHANGMDFYCEMMGQGPTIVIVPDGGNDWGPYEKMMDYLSDEFTVLTFDPRGGSRSPDPHPRPVTPELFSDDIAALVQEVPVEKPISAFGVSSGGQAVLALAKFHTAITRNGVVHEAALQADTPIRNVGFEYFKTIAILSPKIADPATISAITLVGIEAIDAAQRARMAKNHVYWAQYYLGTKAYVSDSTSSSTVHQWSSA